MSDHGPARRALVRIKEADSKPSLLRAAGLVRGLAPGDERLGEGGTHSVSRELGLTAVQVWQSLSEAQGRGRGERDVAILFTDLVDYSSWALDAGDDAAVELLDRVAEATEDAIALQAGELVKRLGDGAMAVFSKPRDAVEAALDALAGVAGSSTRAMRRCSGRACTWAGRASCAATTSGWT